MASIYENENYAVVVAGLDGPDDPKRWYVVINKTTGVQEHTTKQYAEALCAAASLNKAIKEEVWKYITGEKQDPMYAEMERMFGPQSKEPTGGSTPPARFN